VRAAKGARPTEMSTAPKASAPAAAERPSVPDDIVRNPYR
jgi:hypothetical protein